jgi:hypothetical protein
LNILVYRFFFGNQQGLSYNKKGVTWTAPLFDKISLPGKTGITLGDPPIHLLIEDLFELEAVNWVLTFREKSVIM